MLNQGKYVLYPKAIGDALYNAPTAASGSNPFVTLADLNSAVGLNNELSEILANGNITDGNDIDISTGDAINGVVELTLVGAVGVDITATTADIVLTSTAGDIQFSAPSGNIRMRSDVEILDGVTMISATAGVEMDFGSGLYWAVTTDVGIYSTPYIYLDSNTSYGELGDADFKYGFGAGFTPSVNCVYGDSSGFTLVSTGVFNINVVETIVFNSTPTAVLTDSFKIYSADITAGNAAPHFETEGGDVIKLYSETTGIVAAAFVANTSGIADDTATFGGYTIGQIVAALKAQGFLS